MEKIFYHLKNATKDNLLKIEQIQLNNILQYSGKLTDSEVAEIESFCKGESLKNYRQYKMILLENQSINKTYQRANSPQQSNLNKPTILKDEIIGCVFSTLATDSLYLKEIFIEQAYRNRGIASSIINDLIKSTDLPVSLYVYKGNINAIRLYKNLGFEVVFETDNRLKMTYTNEKLSLE